MITLREYQSKAVNDVRQAYADGKRAPLVVLPTGGGKTTIFSYVTQSASAKGRRVFLLCHRAELVKQIAMTLARFNCAHHVVAPPKIVRQCQTEQFKKCGRSYVDTRAGVYVASVQTLVKRLDKIGDPPDIIIIDEAHHLTAASTWGQIVNAYPNAKLLPVTATPCRLDGKGLGIESGGFADDIVLGPTMRELIDMGFLSEYRVFAPPTALDLRGVKTRAGDYAKDDLNKAMDKPTITGDAVAHYMKLARNKRAVAFCVSVDHAKHVADTFNAAGIKAETLDGSADADHREQVIGRFERGETLVLASCEIVSEGFDLPAIECAILLRPTKSTSLFLQQVGRALRVFPGKTEAVILDHVGAVITHGFPDDDREWTLDGEMKRKRAANDNEPTVAVKTCPQCYSVHKPSPNCPSCGYRYTGNERKLQVTDGELVELTADVRQKMREQAQAQKLTQKVLRKKEERQCNSVDELTELGVQRGYQYPRQWAERVFSFRRKVG